MTDKEIELLREGQTELAEKFSDDEIKDYGNYPDQKPDCEVCGKFTLTTIGGMCGPCSVKEEMTASEKVVNEIVGKINLYKEWRKKVIASTSCDELCKTGLLTGIDGTINFYRSQIGL